MCLVFAKKTSNIKQFFLCLVIFLDNTFEVAFDVGIKVHICSFGFRFIWKNE